jgi:hypothetical protein
VAAALRHGGHAAGRGPQSRVTAPKSNAAGVPDPAAVGVVAKCTGRPTRSAARLSTVDRQQRSHRAAVEWAAASSHAPLVAAATQAMAIGVAIRAVVLVEGVSDRVALEALAERRGRNLDAERISVVSIGGAHSIGRFLALFGRQGLDVRLAGLCDAGEEGDVRRGLERAGFGSNLTRADMELLGFYVCVADLEDELIRALGAACVEHVVDGQRELGSFRSFQNQPAQRGRTIEAQLRRFMGTRSGRKVQYARLLVDALDLTKVPRPLDQVLAHL